MYFCRVDLVYTKQYAVFLGGSILLILRNAMYFCRVNLVYTRQYAVFLGVYTAYTMHYAVFSKVILLILGQAQLFPGYGYFLY